MRPCFAVLFSLLIAFALSSCASGKPKSSNDLHEGDAPTIRYYDEREAAGGPLSGGL